MNTNDVPFAPLPKRVAKRRRLWIVIGVPCAIALGLLGWGGLTAVERNHEATAARAALNAFVAALREGRIEQTYRAAAPELRCRMSFQQFRGIAGYYAKMLLDVRSDVTLRRDWPLAPVADIELSTHYDQDLPHHAAMVKLDGGWRVAWIDQKTADEVRAEDARCGERSMHVAMIRQPLSDLLAGAETGDYSAFKGRFQSAQQEAADRAIGAFGKFRPHLAALREAARAEPAFTTDPAFDRDRVWRIEAVLGTEGERFAVRAEAVHDGGWKLTRFDLAAADKD